MRKHYYQRVNRVRLAPLLAVGVFCALGLGRAVPAARPDVSTLQLRWEMQSPGISSPLPQDGALSVFTLTNAGSTALPRKGWALYFTFQEGFQPGPLQDPFVLERVTGPLYRLRPLEGFSGLQAGKRMQIRMVLPSRLINAAQAPESPYLVFDDKPDAGFAIVDYELAPFPGVGATTAEQIYDRNSFIVPVARDTLPPVFPTPRNFEPRPGALRWTSAPRITADANLGAEADAATAMIKPFFVGAKSSEGAPPVHLSIGEVAGLASPEAYELAIDPHSGVSLKGSTAAGVARGLASLRQLLPIGIGHDRPVELPALLIRDAPRFVYRGFMMDVARNFQTKDQVKRVLDLMARFKLNTFHFHLTDDEGWRLEIAGLPELTAIGSRRGHSAQQRDRLPPAYGSGPDVRNPYGTGYYRRADYIEILRYAAARHIEVIPEIEMPGHARAAVVSMAARAEQLKQAGNAKANEFLLHDPQDQSVYQSAQSYSDNVLNPALPSTYAFIDHVVAELVALHRTAGVPLHTIHMGGDELPDGAWDRSPACRALMQREHLKTQADLWDYFYARVGSLLERHGLRVSGWEELGTRAVNVNGQTERQANPAFTRRGYTVYVWRNMEGSEDLADRLANAGYDTVLAPATKLYFDFPPYPSPFEPGQVWAGFVDLETVFDYVPLDDTRIAADEPKHIANRQALTEFGRQHILGLEGTLFSETVHEPGRLDYMLVPRLLALAERAWAADPTWAQQPDRARAAPIRAAAWSTFVSQLGFQVLPRLDAERTVLYRIPAPGLKRVGNAVLANEQIPGLSLRYTVDGSDPTGASPLVTGPIELARTIRVAAFDRNGRAGRASEFHLGTPGSP